MTKKKKEPPDDYVTITELWANHREIREKCQCHDSTLITWCRRYEVDGHDLGIKVGGEWRVSVTLLMGLLQGRALPRLR